MTSGTKPTSDSRRLTGLPAWRVEAWRLWRVWRWPAAVCWFLILGGTLQRLYPVLAGSLAGNAVGRSAVRDSVLYPLVYNVSVQTTGPVPSPLVVIHGQPVVGSTPMWTALVFACVVVALERGRGASLYAVTGPTSRRDLWWVQSTFILAVPLLAETIKILLVAAADGAYQWVLPGHVLVVWWGLSMLVVAAIAAAALFVSAGVGSGLLAGLISVGVCLFPVLAGAILRAFAAALSGAFVAASIVAWLSRAGTAVVRLSPIVNGLSGNQGVAVSSSSPTGSVPGVPPGAVVPPQQMTIPMDTHVHVTAAMAIWLAAWVVVLVVLSWLAFRSAPVERWSELFMYPSWALAAVWLAACTLAALTAQAVHHSLGANFAQLFFPVFLVVGGFFHWRWQRHQTALSLGRSR